MALADLGTKLYASLTSVPLNSGGVMQTNFAGASSFKLTNMVDPTANQDYATKKYHDDNLGDAGIGVVSDTVIQSNDTERTRADVGYEKMKEIIVYENLANVRLSFEIKGVASGGWCFTRVYINGVDQSLENNTNSDTYAPVSEDLMDIKTGDKIQIYGNASSGYTLYVRYMRLKFDKYVNNDP